MTGKFINLLFCLYLIISFNAVLKNHTEYPFTAFYEQKFSSIFSDSKTASSAVSSSKRSAVSAFDFDDDSESSNEGRAREQQRAIRVSAPTATASQTKAILKKPVNMAKRLRGDT